MMIVIKVGTNILTLSGGELDLGVMQNIAQQIKSLVKNNNNVILVSSGAVGCGMNILGINEYPKKIKTRQACASVGQVKLMNAWQIVFGNVIISQNLVTNAVFYDKKNLFDFHQNVKELLRLGVIPIINENDAVSTAEINKDFTDNDRLASLIALLLKANLLFIISDYGLHEENPQINPKAKLIKDVLVIDDKIMRLANGLNKNGRGGMKSKLISISKSIGAGIDTYLIPVVNDGILKALDGKNPGTLFHKKN